MSSIRRDLRNGVLYNGIARYSNVFVSILIGATLARLLTPEEFGVVAIITVFTAFFNLLSSFGISVAIVQNKTLDEDDISSVFAFSFLFGLIAALFFLLSAPFIASFYGNPILIDLTRLMSLSIFFNTLKIVPHALNMKKLRFKEIGIVSVVVHIVTGVIAIVLAFYGFSYYALVINSILNGLLLFLLFYYLEPVKVRFTIKINSIRKIAKYSTYQFLFQFINYFAGNLDNLLIGKYFSASSLGFYEKAYKLMLLPVQNLTFVITPVLHPILSEFQNDKDIIYKAYYKIVKILSLVGFPLSIVLYFNASEIIYILYGPQWGLSIPVFEFLALAVGIQIVLSSGGSIFQATNRTDLLFLSGLISTVFVAVAIFYGIFLGKTLESIGIGLLIAFAINFFQAFYLLINKCLNKSFLSFLKVLYFPIILSFCIALTLWVASFISIENNLLSFLTKLLVSILTFGIVLISSRENLSFVKEYATKMIKK